MFGSPDKKYIKPERSLPEKHQKLDRIAALRRCQLFKTLSSWELMSISRLTRLIEFKKDETVFHAGETASSLYIVISGRFEAYVSQAHGKKVLAYIKQGGFFGEMALISDVNHSATVRALSDSLAISISKSDFENILGSNAKISVEISRILSARLRGQGDTKIRQPHLLKSDIIAVYSSHRKTGQTAFSMNLAASLRHETGERTVLIDMSPSGHVVFDRLSISKKTDVRVFKQLEKSIEGTIASHLVSHSSGIEAINLATENAGDRAAELTIHLINRLAVDFRYIVVDLPNSIDAAVLKVLAQADHQFFVTDNNMPNVSEIQAVIQDLDRSIESSNEKTKVVINESFLGFSPTAAVKRELFGSKDCFFLPSTPGLKDDHLEDQRLIVLNSPDLEYSKLIRHIARKISKNLIGLALGSGAALGFAHAGVIKVLEREKIPIDFLAGSSMGAVVAAIYSKYGRASALEELAAKFNTFQIINRMDFSVIPLRGMIIGHRIFKLFEEYLHKATFDDLKIPLLVIGSNIQQRKKIIMNTGLVSEALRASISIPGIFHPVERDGNIIIDGGVIDPLPIRPLTELGINKIIAVDVLPSTEDMVEKKRYYDELERRMDLRVKKRNFLIRMLYKMRKEMGRVLNPNWVDIIVNSMQTMEHELAVASAAEADVLVRPRMPLVNWVAFHKSKELIQCGEEAAEAMVEDFRALVKQQTI